MIWGTAGLIVGVVSAGWALWSTRRLRYAVAAPDLHAQQLRQSSMSIATTSSENARIAREAAARSAEILQDMRMLRGWPMPVDRE